MTETKRTKCNSTDDERRWRRNIIHLGDGTCIAIGYGLTGCPLTGEEIKQISKEETETEAVRYERRYGLSV